MEQLKRAALEERSRIVGIVQAIIKRDDEGDRGFHSTSLEDVIREINRGN